MDGGRQVCKRGIHVTKRDLFYTDVKLFTKQNESDECLEEAAAMLGCTRSSLNGALPPPHRGCSTLGLLSHELCSQLWPPRRGKL